MLLGENGDRDINFNRTILVCDHEVTQGEYQAIMGFNPSFNKGSYKPDMSTSYNTLYKGDVQENRPVDTVGWYYAIAYCNKRSIAEGLEPCYTATANGVEVDWENLKPSDVPKEIGGWKNINFSYKNGYRLLTADEWEMAARGGLIGKVYSSQTSDADNGYKGYVWCYETTPKITNTLTQYNSNQRAFSREVKKCNPNNFGLYDMCGNISEMVWVSNSSTQKAFGGAYGLIATSCYVYSSTNISFIDRKENIGFRVCRTVME